jgi:hypothetical protein
MTRHCVPRVEWFLLALLQAAERFNKDPGVAGLLLTSRAGGLGLNLSSASTAFFLEHDWNPMVQHPPLTSGLLVTPFKCKRPFQTDTGLCPPF